ncbi:MAG: Fic family protein [Bacteroides sp.]
MDELFQWYEANKDSMHPVVLAAQMHEKLVSVHPFLTGMAGQPVS